MFASYYGEAMTKDRLESFVGLMRNCEPSEVEMAMENLMRNPEITRMPLPGKVLQEINPTETPIDAAQCLLLRAQEAVTRFGFYQPDAAKEYVGEIAWSALGGEPGWRDFCAVKSSEAGVARAQLRERLRVVIQRGASGGRVSLGGGLQPLGITAGEFRKLREAGES